MSAGAPAAVLVVNDYAAQRLAVRAILAPIGLAVVEADSGRAALRAVLRQTFAAILMDVRMPTLDGYETAKLIRERRERELTPIIFMTAYGRDETDTFAGYAQGAVDFIFTPVDPDLLRARISALVELYLQTQGLRDLADSEPLTGLLNRRRFDEELTTQVTRSSRYDERAALLMIDLDGFKAVNDTHGHPAGDLLLLSLIHI